MATSNGTSNTFPLHEDQGTPSASRSDLVDATTLEDKLFVLGRAPCWTCFEELRKQEIFTPYLLLACTWLVQNIFSADNRDAAVRLIAGLLWPAGSWFVTTDQLFMYLATPDGSNISQRALIRVNRWARSPISIVTLLGQHDRQDFDLRDLSQLYKLFEAVVESEFT
ncbi:hypothetical protein G6011_11622 [Alternaria panax]|uniref:Uncharacterized protein n=1 Tax=Alternaria panax TaxID=48097 RepID=A0AAD4IDX6_9PLEO|nr:hypothetical protein G6011_11622 [Alternaria panax]